MVVIIDQYDSFSYNVAQYLGELGEDIRLFRNDAVRFEQLLDLAPSCMIISSGAATPKNIELGSNLIKQVAGTIPLLGISLGHQLIAQHFGGQSRQAEQPIHGKTTPIFHDRKTLFRDIPAPFLGARYHSFVVERATLPECLEISAWTEEGLIMGLRHKHLAVEGIQFHPESILTEQGKQILKNFLNTYALVK